MTWLVRGERSVGRPWRRWIFDGTATMVAFAVASPYVFYDDRHNVAPAMIALVAVHAPLLLRRVYPVPVFAWVFVAASAAVLWNDHVIGGLGVLVALYTVVATQPRRTASAATALVEVAALSAALTSSSESRTVDALLLSGLVGLATGLGIHSWTRRAYLAELISRAVHLEIERDQQGALAAAAERDRISREMHDIVAHHLTVMVALSDGAAAATASSPERGIEVMRVVSETGRSALADTRRLLGVLHRQRDSALDGCNPTPVRADLESLIERVCNAGVPTTLTVSGAGSEATRPMHLAVFRIVQEALTNTLKHGGSGTCAEVDVRYGPEAVDVSVRDNGAGVRAKATDGSGIGLIGMRERALVHGGTFTAGPHPTGGWAVAATLYVGDAVGAR
ncbi:MULTISPECIES: sensor histidine kinase [Nocardiaceae]|uniref:sensor histidine kinase n=1 Tax=Nocardiaceae TaxID=85025 RepID=UPI00068AAB4F|nr:MULTISPECIES: histidine kinase [Rhodococcus]MDQ0279971.1 signal transduction histidine kinase [Rhodococcus fascians]OZD05970.1 two-component sensor histidine kinase [Rhodococcus sp. 06-221-2]